jgi:hypothetical protein
MVGLGSRCDRQCDQEWGVWWPERRVGRKLESCSENSEGGQTGGGGQDATGADIDQRWQENFPEPLWER